MNSTLPDLQNASVLVIGDIMLDRFIYGSVDRISPESPVPVLLVGEEAEMLGGAGNVLANLAGLQVKAHILAIVGEDDTANAVRAQVKRYGADPAGLIAASDRPTTVKTRYLAAHQQLLRTDFEKKAPLPPAIEGEILSKAKDIIPGVGAVILSDYGKGVLTPGLIAKVISLTKNARIPVIVDPKGSDYSIYKGAFAVTPNRKELSEATNGLPTDSDQEIYLASQNIIKNNKIESVVATRSQNGMTVVEKGKDPVHLPTEAQEVFDVSGAGDTVIAVIGAALAAGSSLNDAAALANTAGGIVVGKVGTAPIRLQELQEASADQNLQKDTPILSWEETAEQVQRWKARGLKIGFTNGCFDILHPGHVSYLTAARRECDRLIVGLNVDASVKRLKGSSRPINNEQARASVLAGLSAVDTVVLFGQKKEEEDTPCHLIEYLRPSIFFKGGDYTLAQLPESRIIEGYGGAIKIMPMVEGHSTTEIIDKTKP